jgi:hypothetical protein
VWVRRQFTAGDDAHKDASGGDGGVVGDESLAVEWQRWKWAGSEAEALHWESIGQWGKQKGSSSQATPANRL